MCRAVGRCQILGWHPLSKSPNLLKILERHNYWWLQILGGHVPLCPPCSYGPDWKNNLDPFNFGKQATLKMLIFEMMRLLFAFCWSVPRRFCWFLPMMESFCSVKVFSPTLTLPSEKCGPSNFPSLHSLVSNCTGFIGSRHWLYPHLKKHHSTINKNSKWEVWT